MEKGKGWHIACPVIPMTSLKFVPKKIVFLFFGDVLIIGFAYLLAVSLRLGHLSFHLTGHYAPEAALLLTCLCIFYIADFYDVDSDFANARYLFNHMAGMIFGSLIMMLVFFFIPATNYGRSVFLISGVIIGIATLFWRLMFAWWLLRNPVRKKRVLIIGAGRAGKMLYDVVRDSPSYEAVGFMIDDVPMKWGAGHLPQVKGGSDVLISLTKSHQVDILVLAMSSFIEPQLLKSVLDCKLDGTQVYDMPSFYEMVMGKVPVKHVTDFWLVFTPLMGIKKSIYNQKLKRITDVALSFFGLLVTLPLSFLVALSVKLDSAGPVLYRQPRIGLNGKPFILFKFRSMTSGTDYDRRFAGKRNDPRITRVGKFIRLSRFDEVPQMWNVLTGNMSFIGPRALIRAEVKKFEASIPYFSLRHSVRPGITGWAQVKYKHGALVEDGLEKLQYDLFYIKHLSPLLDFHILMRTIKVVLSGKGAR